MKLTRNFEAIPTGAGEYLARDLCYLQKYSHPLEILRDSNLELDAQYVLSMMRDHLNQ